jgi:hypothetical protein
MILWGVRIVMLLALTGCDALFHLDTVDLPVDGPSSGCPPSYVQLATGWYRVEVTGRTWGGAEAICAADGVGLVGKYTHLAVTGSSISASMELDTIYPLVQPATKVWLGLSDRATLPAPCPGGTPGNFYQWVTDEPLSVPRSGPPWYPGDPLNPCLQQCVTMLPNQAVLDDQSCGDLYSSVCECDDFAADPSHF